MGVDVCINVAVLFVKIDTSYYYFYNNMLIQLHESTIHRSGRMHQFGRSVFDHWH